MNPELNPTQLLTKALEEPTAATSAPATSAPATSLADGSASGQSRPESLGFGLDLDGEDASLAKAQTLMIDLPSREEECLNLDTPVEISRYIQGVIQGQRAYIITNLLGESEALVQPQMVWTIGRNRDAALPLKDRVMSRRHAVLLYAPDSGFQLIDLNSMNGSFINGAKIRQRHALKDGDRIRVGSTNFTFFVSHRQRSLDEIHPEVLARFNGSEVRSGNFIDYAALEDPEILFRTNRP